MRSDMTHPVDPAKQALRLRRFLIASMTYVLGITILALCSAAGLLPARSVWIVAGAFAGINAVFFALFKSGANLRFEDPSLTLPQVCAAASVVVLILVLGERIHFVAVPFYSSLFVFAMLQLRARQLVVAEVVVLAGYALAFYLRARLYGDRLDLRVEAIHAALVVLSSLWYAFAASYISNLRARLRESVHTIERLATRDAVTECINRRHIDELLAAELQRRTRLGGELCVCLIDLDRFKSINDRFGHPTGDSVLRSVAQCMQAQLRTVDRLGRFGGEEFLGLLPGTPVAAARACAERLRAAVAALRVLPADEAVTVSIGLAACTENDTAATLIARADAALYRAKAGGRDRVEVGDTPVC
jgi:diguanylate cyclase